MTPNYILIRAAKAGLPRDLRLALDAGAKADLVDDNGYPVIHYAALSGDVNCVQELLEFGADIDAENTAGLTAVQLCLQEGRHALAAYLFDRQADGSVLWPDMRNVLHFAVALNNPGLIRRGVQRGANVNGARRGGGTAILAAACDNKVACVRKLLDFGANVRHLAAVQLSAEMEMAVSAWRAHSLFA